MSLSPSRSLLLRHRHCCARGTWQLPNTDVAIYTFGDPMLLWRKPYEKSAPSDPWVPSYPLVPLVDGSLFVWKTGPGSAPDILPLHLTPNLSP